MFGALISQAPSKAASRSVVGLTTALMVTLATLGQGALANLIGYFHLTRAVAVIIVNLIVSGGFWTLALLYPFVVPVEITLQTLIRLFGVTYAIGW